MTTCPYCGKKIRLGDMCCSKCFEDNREDFKTGMMYQLSQLKNNKRYGWNLVNNEMKNTIKRKKLFEVLQG